MSTLPKFAVKMPAKMPAKMLTKMPLKMPGTVAALALAISGTCTVVLDKMALETMALNTCL